MAFLKSIILVVFCIGWVKAVQYDFDAEFNRIFHQIRNSFENAWKWMNAAANRSYIRMNEIFTTRKPTEQGRLHKYQDVVPRNDTTVSLENVPIQAESADVSQTSPNTQNSAAIIVTPESPLSSPLKQLASSITTPDSSSPQTPEDNSNMPQNDTIEVPQQPPKSPDLQSNDSKAKQATEEQVHSETQPPEKLPEPQIDDVSSTKESTEDKVHSETQTDSETSAKSKTELPLALQDAGTGDSQVSENQTESDMKIKIAEPVIDDEKESLILETDRPERIGFETKRVLPSIYDQQNIIILFLFFLIVLMSIYFFLLDRTRSCPTIVIQRDLCGNLKPTMDLYKK